MATRRFRLEIFLVCLAAILLEISYTRVFSYKLNPQTVLFAGYSDSQLEDDLTRELEKTGRTLFFKLSYAWTP